MKETLSLLFALFCSMFLAAESFPECSDAREWNLVQADKRSQRLLPPQSGNGFLLELDESVFPYAELQLKKARRLPELREGEFLLTVTLEKPEAIRSFSLRLTDRDKEFFQFPQQPVRLVRGKNRILFRIGENEQKTSWGRKGKTNRKIDYPLSLAGITCRVRPGFGNQRVQIHSLELNPETARQTTMEQPFLFFDNRSRFTLSGRNSVLEQTPDGLLLRMKGKSVTLKEHKWSLRPWTAPRQIVFHGKVRKGSGTLRLDCIAGKKKSIRLGTTFSPDSDTLTLNITGENSEIRFQKLTILSETPETEILFRSAVIRSAATAAEAIRFDVETGNELHILKEGEEKKLAFRCTNTSPLKLSGRGNLILRDFFGKELRKEFSFSLRPGESRTIPVQLPRLAFGIWQAEAQITTAKPQSTATHRTTFAFLRPAGPTPEHPGEQDFLFGICTHTSRWAQHDRKLEAEAAGICGAKIIRTNSHWHSIQPRENVWNYQDFDELVKLFGEQGIQLQAGFGYGARWAAPESTRNSRKWTDWHRAMPNLDAWRKYVSTTAARYRESIRYWEVWNEPDLYSFAHFGAEDYAKLLKSAWEEVKKVNPRAIVMNGGFASVRPMGNPKKDNVQFQKEILRNCRGYYDLHAHHEHSNFPVYVSVIDSLLLPMRKETGADAVPWYANETAISSASSGENMQALTLFKKLIFSWSRGAVGYTWYDLRNDGCDPYNAEHHYGMMTLDFHPKPIYPVYNALAAVYGKARFVEQRQIGRDLYLFLFRRGKDLLAAAWNEQNNPANLPFIFQTDAQAAEQIDIMGNSAPIKLSDGTGIFTVGAIPATLRLKGATRVAFPGAVVEASAPQAAIRGKTVPLALKLRNPLKQALNFQFELMPSPLFRSEKRRFQCQLAGESEQTITHKLIISPELPGDFQRKFYIRLRFAIPTLKSTGTIDLPFQQAIHIPADSRRTGADFVLDQPSQTFSFWEGQPSKAHLLWQGKQDLSAEIFLKLKEKSLQLTIDVRDDLHCQPESGRFVWRGDNIQFSLTLPDQAGSWEIGLTRLKSGDNETFVWHTPAGFDAEKCASEILLHTERKGDHTIYQAEIPLATLRTAPATMRRGVRFNLLINDNDGECRKGGLQIVPQLKNAERHPLVVFE